jgi:hypothetical protein
VLPCVLRLAACRDADDALCAVCGEGHSEAPNQILFCERCDVPVHQVRSSVVDSDGCLQGNLQRARLLGICRQRQFSYSAAPAVWR